MKEEQSIDFINDLLGKSCTGCVFGTDFAFCVGNFKL